jgi:hypothetical protein
VNALRSEHYSTKTNEIDGRNKAHVSERMHHAQSIIALKKNEFDRRNKANHSMPNTSMVAG